MKYSRKKNRLKYYDYSRNNYYFITICTKFSENIFGEIINGESVLNKYGEVVNKRLLWLEKQYFYIKLDEYIIMPNHIHVLMKIDYQHVLVKDSLKSIRMRTTQELSLTMHSRRHNLLSKVIAALKMTSSKLIHL